MEGTENVIAGNKRRCWIEYVVKYIHLHKEGNICMYRGSGGYIEICLNLIFKFTKAAENQRKIYFLAFQTQVLAENFIVL
jgi:hypothetical protein